MHRYFIYLIIFLINIYELIEFVEGRPGGGGRSRRTIGYTGSSGGGLETWQIVLLVLGPVGLIITGACCYICCAVGGCCDDCKMSYGTENCDDDNTASPTTNENIQLPSLK